MNTTQRVLGRLLLAAPTDIVAARQCTRRVAELLGLTRQSQVRIATAVSEVARNAFQHARAGEAVFVVRPALRPERLEIVVRDQGPGIPDVDAVLEARAPGRGAGLVSARRLVDGFALTSSPQGTVVTLTQHIPRTAAATLAADTLEHLCHVLPAAPDDPVDVVQQQNRELIESLSELDERWKEESRLSQELEETNRGVVALYSELEHQAEQLRSASDMKTRFLSNMSHEFRTPLNSILALSRLLADGVDGPLGSEQQRQVDYIRRSAQGLLELVNDLLDLAKVEAGKVEVRPTTFVVQHLFSSLRGLLRPLLTNPAVELRFEPADELTLYADEHKVAQILRNLIANALKFTQSGSVSVSARHDAAAGKAYLAVRDTGIGIAPGDHERIFEEFAQIDGPLQKGGTGLGLPLSRRLAQVMGGDLTLTSAPGAGATFTLTLPLQTDPVLAGSRDGGAGRLLVVDDEEAFRYIVRHIAQDAGFVVEEATDGDAGLQALRSRRPDAVMLDLQMPGRNGFELLDELAALPDPPPALVCTSQMLSMEQKRSLARAHAILSKSDVTREGLTALLRAMVQRSKERR